jgi:8-oxo-dGTP pyrophosphatase MutT (NUDIX family)
MRREFREEANLDVRDWQEVLTITGRDDAGSGIPGAATSSAPSATSTRRGPLTDEQLELHAVALCRVTPFRTSTGSSR